MSRASYRDLEAELRALGRVLAFPPTPRIASAVAAKLRSAEPRGGQLPGRSPWRPLSRGLILAVVGALLLVTAAVAVGWGLGGLQLRFVQSSPPPSARAEFGLNLGEEVTLEEARARVSFEILLPALGEIGDPDEVYLTIPPAGGGVALIYGARDGFPADQQTGIALVLTEFRRDIGPETFAKLINAGVTVTPTTVSGEPGYWIAGGDHMLIYVDEEGREQFEMTRLVGDTLIWEQAGLTLRLENAPSLESARRVAESVR